MSNTTNLSIVVPLFAEEESVREFYNCLTEILDNKKYNYEIIFAIDKSRDATYQIVHNLAIHDSRVKYLLFSYRIGHQRALMAGIAKANKENIIVTIDGDLQHPPSIIPELIDSIRVDSVSIAQSLRVHSVDKRLFLRKLSTYIYKIFSKFSGIDLKVGTTDFRAITPEVATLLRENYLDKNPFIRGYLGSLSLPTSYVEYFANNRLGGQSKFTFKSLTNLSLNALVGFSTKPLKIIMLMGMWISALSFICSIAVVIVKIVDATQVPGYTTLFFAIFFLAGIQIFSLGIIGLYISEALTSIQNRPLYMIEKSKNL